MKFLFLILLLSFSALVRAEVIDKIVAKVGSDVITMSDMSQALTQQRSYLVRLLGKEKGTAEFENFRTHLLDELILDKILKTEIKKESISSSAVELDQEHRTRLKQFSLTDASLETQLNKEGISLADYKNKIKEDLDRQKFIQKKIMPRVSALSVSDLDLQEEYKKNISKFQTYNQLHFIEVFLTSDKFASAEEMTQTAQNIQNKLKAGQSVGDLIKKYSSGAFATNGGDSGNIKANQLRPEIQNVLSSLKPGEVSQIFSSGPGVFVFKLLSKSDPSPVPFNQVANVIRSRYSEKLVNDELKKYLLNIKDQTYVEIVK